MDAGDELILRIQKIRKDPLEFLRGVRTLDQVDSKCPIKPFPVHLDYVQLYCGLWVRERFIAVPKSRRMKMTWTNIALYTWDTLFNVGKAQAFVSKKETDACDLVDRAKFIIEHLDHSIIPKDIVPKHDSRYGKLWFPEIHSSIEAFPQGADQLRQFTFSGILADEMGFWDNAQEMYSGSVPTLEGGGRFTAISSAAPGFFKRLVFDELDQDYAEDDSESRGVSA